MAMGVDIRREGDCVVMTGKRPLSPLDMSVPGDISSAAFPMVAATIVPHSEVTITNVGINETRTGVFEMLRQMGGEFSLINERMSGGEPVADIVVGFSELHSSALSGAMVEKGMDEMPIMSVAATQALGETAVSGAAELRVKEVDRISVLAGELLKLGVNIVEAPDGFTVTGPSRLYSNEVDSHDAHRLGMSLSVAGLVTHGMTLVDDATCMADSFPGFVETMQSLGANMEWIEQ